MLLGHVGGIPIEETVGSFGPVLLVAISGAVAMVSARFHRVAHCDEPHVGHGRGGGASREPR